MRHQIKPAFVRTIPEHLDEGVLYISKEYATASHKCCCGCGQEVVTPLTREGWNLVQRKKLVSLYPSIGNWQYACQSHYFIKKNKIIWLSSSSVNTGPDKNITPHRWSTQLLALYRYIMRLLFKK